MSSFLLLSPTDFWLHGLFPDPCSAVRSFSWHCVRQMVNFWNFCSHLAFYRLKTLPHYPQHSSSRQSWSPFKTPDLLSPSKRRRLWRNPFLYTWLPPFTVTAVPPYCRRLHGSSVSDWLLPHYLYYWHCLPACAAFDLTDLPLCDSRMAGAGGPSTGISAHAFSPHTTEKSKLSRHDINAGWASSLLYGNLFYC